MSDDTIEQPPLPEHPKIPIRMRRHAKGDQVHYHFRNGAKVTATFQQSMSLDVLREQIKQGMIMAEARLFAHDMRGVTDEMLKSGRGIVTANGRAPRELCDLLEFVEIT